MYYNECPICGASLDPGEKCDCQTQGKNTHKRVEACEAATQQTSNVINANTLYLYYTTQKGVCQ